MRGKKIRIGRLGINDLSFFWGGGRMEEIITVQIKAWVASREGHEEVCI